MLGPIKLNVPIFAVMVKYIIKPSNTEMEFFKQPRVVQKTQNPASTRMDLALDNHWRSILFLVGSQYGCLPFFYLPLMCFM